MGLIKLISTFIIIFTCTGCSIQGYYFPISELTNGKVYKYECKLDPTKTEYWKITSDIQKNTLITEAYESDFRQYEFFKERVTDKGTEVVEFISYLRTNIGTVPPAYGIPIDVDVFKWKTKEPYKYSVEIEYNENIKMMFSKERAYVEKCKISILGKEYDAIKLKGNYKSVVCNSTEKYEYTQFSYYIKGIGLAKMEKEYSDGKKITLELTEVLTIEQWNKRQ